MSRKPFYRDFQFFRLHTARCARDSVQMNNIGKKSKEKATKCEFNSWLQFLHIQQFLWFYVVGEHGRMPEVKHAW